MRSREVRLGIDLGGTSFSAVLLDPRAGVVARRMGRTGDHRDPGPVLDRLADLVQSLLDEAGISPDGIAGGGIGLLPTTKNQRVTATNQPRNPRHRPGERTLVTKLGERLASRGRRPFGARVLLVGVGYKIGSADLTRTPAEELVRRLRAAKADVAYLDSLVEAFHVDQVPVPRVAPDLDRVPSRWDAAILLSGDPDLSAARLASLTDLVIDAGGGRSMDLVDGVAQGDLEIARL